MDIIKKFLEHLDAMGKLAGKATDYPVMLCIYLGIFLICTVASVMLYFSKYGKRVVWLPDQHKVIKSNGYACLHIYRCISGGFVPGGIAEYIRNLECRPVLHNRTNLTDADCRYL